MSYYLKQSSISRSLEIRLNVSVNIIAPFHFSATAGHIQTFTGQEVRDLLPRSLFPSLDQRATVLADSFQNGILKENENVYFQN